MCACMHAVQGASRRMQAQDNLPPGTSQHLLVLCFGDDTTHSSHARPFVGVTWSKACCRGAT